MPKARKEVADTVEDRQSRRPLAFILAMLVTLLVGILAVLAFAYTSLRDALGVWLWLLLAFAVSMEVLSGVSDLRDM